MLGEVLWISQVLGQELGEEVLRGNFVLCRHGFGGCLGFSDSLVSEAHHVRSSCALGTCKVVSEREQKLVKAREYTAESRVAHVIFQGSDDSADVFPSIQKANAFCVSDESNDIESIALEPMSHVHKQFRVRCRELGETLGKEFCAFVDKVLIVYLGRHGVCRRVHLPVLGRTLDRLVAEDGPLSRASPC